MAEDGGLCDRLRLDLQLKRHADDLFPETRLTEKLAHATLDLDTWTVVPVDDVMYHGNSMLRTLEYLAGRDSHGGAWTMVVQRDCRCAPASSACDLMWHRRTSSSNAMPLSMKENPGCICYSRSRRKKIWQANLKHTASTFCRQLLLYSWISATLPDLLGTISVPNLIILHR